MAILIKKDKPINILGGLQIKEIYLRFFYTLSWDGETVIVKIKRYLSKDAFKKSADIDYNIQISGINEQYIFKYNRETNGIDILKYIHDSIIEILITDKTQMVAKLNDDGEIIYDRVPILTEDGKRNDLLKQVHNKALDRVQALFKKEE